MQKIFEIYWDEINNEMFIETFNNKYSIKTLMIMRNFISSFLRDFNIYISSMFDAKYKNGKADKKYDTVDLLDDVIIKEWKIK